MSDSQSDDDLGDDGGGCRSDVDGAGNGRHVYAGASWSAPVYGLNDV